MPFVDFLTQALDADDMVVLLKTQAARMGQELSPAAAAALGLTLHHTMAPPPKVAVAATQFPPVRSRSEKEWGLRQLAGSLGEHASAALDEALERFHQPAKHATTEEEPEAAHPAGCADEPWALLQALEARCSRLSAETAQLSSQVRRTVTPPPTHRPPIGASLTPHPLHPSYS